MFDIILDDIHHYQYTDMHIYIYIYIYVFYIYIYIYIIYIYNYITKKTSLQILNLLLKKADLI